MGLEASDTPSIIECKNHSGLPEDVGALFGSSGIRGPFPDPICPDLALRIGAAAGIFAKRVLVGHDVRRSSPLLKEAFVAGVVSTGAQVEDGGGAATPSLAYAARDRELAISITASHNPAPDNGFKFWNPDGSAWSQEQERSLEALLEETPRPGVSWREVGRRRLAEDVSRRHREAILRFAGPVGGTVVLDCGNGAGGWISPALFREAGLDVEVLFGEPDGRFPHRASEPSDENLAFLKRRCRERQAWGIAHDGDADRMVAVTPEGALLVPDVVLVALALARNAKRLSVPIDASAGLQRVLPEVRWEFTRVGDAAVSASLKGTGGDLGGETSGTYIVPAFDLAPDGPLAGLLFLQCVRDGSVAEAVRRLPRTYRLSDKMALGAVSRGALRAALSAVGIPRGAKATDVDGLRIDAEEGWFLVRPSGTEPILRITAEAVEPGHAKALLERARGVARDALATAARESRTAPLTRV